MAQLMFKIASEQPTDILSIRPDVPAGLVAFLDKAFAKARGELLSWQRVLTGFLVSWAKDGEHFRTLVDEHLAVKRALDPHGLFNPGRLYAEL